MTWKNIFFFKVKYVNPFYLTNFCSKEKTEMILRSWTWILIGLSRIKELSLLFTLFFYTLQLTVFISSLPLQSLYFIWQKSDSGLFKTEDETGPKGRFTFFFTSLVMIIGPPPLETWEVESLPLKFAEAYMQFVIKH